MALSDLPLEYIDYERANTGRAWFNEKRQGGSRAAVNIKSVFQYEPGHPGATTEGYVNLVDGSFENLTKKQAAALATVLMRFAKSGSIMKRGGA